MRHKVSAWLKRNALNIGLLLIAVNGALAVYSVVGVENERTASILRSCQNQNDRNTATLKYIHKVAVSDAAKKHISLKKSERELEPFVLLMDAAVPYRNCQHILAKSTSTHWGF